MSLHDVIYAKSSKDPSSGETLAEHTLKCLKIADTLVANLPFEDSLVTKVKQDLLLAIALHDTGKAASGFQRALQKGSKRWGHRHEILSASFASSLGAKEEIILAVITHHKKLPMTGIADEIHGCLPFEEIPWINEINPMWNQLSKEWYDNILSFSKEWMTITGAIDRGDLSDPSMIKLNPLKMDKKWLKRNKQVDHVPLDRRYYASLLRGLLISSDHIASNNMVNPEFLPPRVPILSKYKLTQGKQGEFFLRGFQKNTAEHAGNLIVRAPTGSGKTLAAILWAQTNQKKNGRIFYVLPNIASINAMQLRLQNDFGKELVGALHSRVTSSIYSMLESDDDLISRLNNQSVARTINSLVREMWFPIRVSTPHQILRYTLQGKGWEAMLSEFPNSCFIFDEVHAYEPTIIGLTVATAKYLVNHNASCLFLSATLPKFIRQILTEGIGLIHFLEPSPNDGPDRRILEQKRHSLDTVDGDIMSNIEMILNQVESAKSTLVVCNHVRTSQMVYSELEKYTSDIVLLHSRFCKRDRNKIEGRILKELPRILVSTQVVEVSLDLDFERCFTEPAPIDALIQRFGRVNRFGRHLKPAAVSIFTKQVQKHNIYDKNLVAKSLVEISKLKNPLEERNLVDAADIVYSEGYTGDSKHLYEQAINHPRIKNFEANLVAGTSYDWVEEVIKELDGTIEVLPASLKQDYERLAEIGLKVEAYNLLVPVRAIQILSLIEFVDRSSDPWIIDMPYSEKYGLDLSGEGYLKDNTRDNII